MSNNNLFTTHYPTTPVQDKFGQVIMNWGASKIEIASLQIAAALVSNPQTYDGKILPEAIAEEAYNIALAVFEKLDEEYKKAASVVVPGAASPIIKKL